MKVSPVLPMPDSSQRLSIVISRLIFEIGNCSARHAADSAVRTDGGHHPSRRFVGGLVVAEVGDADIVDIVWSSWPCG